MAMVINDPEMMQAFLLVNPELQGALRGSGLGINFGDGQVDLEDQAERVRRATDPHLENLIPESKFLLYNILSTQWTCTKFQANPAAYPALYIFGMAAYALSLPIRVTIFVVAFLRWVVSPLVLCCADSRDFGGEMKGRSLVMLGALGEMVSGVVGVVCPPLAYAFDEVIQSNETIHDWYKVHRLSLWSDELESSVSGNAERVSRKKAAVRQDMPYFQSSREDLASNYLSAEEEVDAMSSAALELIMHFGFLELLSRYCNTHNPSDEPLTLEELAGSPLEQYCNHALDASGDGRGKTNTQRGLLAAIEQFRKCWHACQERPSIPARDEKASKGIWHYFTSAVQVVTRSAPEESEDESDGLFFQGIKAALILNAGSVQYHAEGTKEQLQAQLARLQSCQVVVDGEVKTGREAVEIMADAIQRFSSTVKSTDREMETLILREAYPQ